MENALSPDKSKLLFPALYFLIPIHSSGSQASRQKTPVLQAEKRFPTTAKAEPECIQQTREVTDSAAERQRQAPPRTPTGPARSPAALSGDHSSPAPSPQGSHYRGRSSGLESPTREREPSPHSCSTAGLGQFQPWCVLSAAREAGHLRGSRIHLTPPKTTCLGSSTS